MLNPFAQPNLEPPPTNTSLAGKTVLVTGANTGLGYGSARSLLQMGVKTLILGVRSVSKGEAAKLSLLADPVVLSRNPNADVQVMELDLAEYQSVIEFADKIIKAQDALDLLILNAGVALTSWQISTAGHEMVIQVNYLSTALLMLLLLPKLDQSARKEGSAVRTRICWVGSEGQIMHSLTRHPIQASEGILSHFDDKAKYRSWTRYMDSKLLVSMFVQMLAEQIPVQQGVIINNFCPGMVKTSIDAFVPWYLKPIVAVWKLARARTVEEGARATIYAGVVAGEETHGKFLRHNRLARSHLRSLSFFSQILTLSRLAPYVETAEGRAAMAKLWVETIEELTKVDQRVNEALRKHTKD